VVVGVEPKVEQAVPPGGDPVVPGFGVDPVDVGQLGDENPLVVLPAGVPFGEVLQPRRRQRGGVLREPGVRRQPAVDVAGRSLLATDVVQQPGPVGEDVVVGDERSALAGRERLRLPEAERARVAERPDLPAAPLAALGVGRVLDEKEIALADRLEQLVHRHRVAREVDADHTDGPLGDDLAEVIDVEIVRLGIGVDEARDGTDGGHRTRARDERVGGDDWRCRPHHRI